MLRLLLAVSFLTFTIVSHSQRFHIGVFGGAAAYNGDLTERPFPKKVTNGVIGGTLNFELTDNIMLRGQLSYAVVGGADRYSNKAELRARNLSFETRIMEASLVGEYYLLNLYDHKFTPYVFAGLAFYHHYPYAYSADNSRKVYLRRLRTEGQGLRGYPGTSVESNYQWAIPLGGGVKYALTSRIHIGLELGIRKLFTDYFDDVSGNYADPADLLAGVNAVAVEFAYRGDEVPGGDPAYPGKGEIRGSPKYKDLYYFTGLHLSYRLGIGGSAREGRSGRYDKLGCPPSVY